MEEVELDGRVAPSADALRAPVRVLAHAANPNVTRMIQPEMALGVTPSAARRQAAEAFHERTGPQTAARRAAFAVAYGELGRPDAVVLTMCSAGYLPLLERWVASCDDRGVEVRDRTVIAALDAATGAWAAEAGLRSVAADPGGPDVDGADGFDDSRFGSVMLHKHLVVLDALHVAPAVLFQDADLLWFRDPVPELAETADEVDLQFMHDGPNRFHRPLYANAGFVFIAANDATRSVFETALRNSAAVLALRSMQAPLNRIVAHYAAHNLVRVSVLPEHRYLNGHLFNLERGVRPAAGAWRDDGVVLHYSWTGNLAQKRAKLERFDLA